MGLKSVIPERRGWAALVSLLVVLLMIANTVNIGADLAAIGTALGRLLARGGVLDEEGWNLLVPNSAVAAKLRQCLPLIEQVLLDEGWARVALRVKVQTPER